MTALVKSVRSLTRDCAVELKNLFGVGVSSSSSAQAQQQLDIAGDNSGALLEMERQQAEAMMQPGMATGGAEAICAACDASSKDRVCRPFVWRTWRGAASHRARIESLASHRLPFRDMK